MLYYTHVILHTCYITHMLYYTHVLLHTCYITHILYFTNVMIQTCYITHMLYYTHVIIHTYYITHMLYYTHVILHTYYITHVILHTYYFTLLLYYTHVILLTCPHVPGLEPGYNIPPKSTIEMIVQHGEYNLAGTGCAGNTFTQEITVKDKVELLIISLILTLHYLGQDLPDSQQGGTDHGDPLREPGQGGEGQQ